MSPGQICFEQTFTTYDVALSGAVDLETLSCNDDIGRDVAILGKSGAATVMGVLPSDSGGFGQLITVDLGTQSPPASLVRASINGDGRDDLWAAVERGGTDSKVFTATANATGTPTCVFGNPGELSMFEGDARQLAVLRFANSDALDDFVLSLGKTNEDELMVRTSPSTSPLLEPVAGTVSEPRGLAVGFFDADGDPDVVYASASQGRIAVRLGVGASSPYFGAASTFSVGGTDRTPVAVAAGDMNGDGVDDILAANRSSSTVSVLLNGGSASFPTANEYPTTSPQSSGGRTPIRLVVADMDLDGDQDVVTVNVDDGGSAPSVSLLQNDGSGNLSMAPSFPRVVSGIPASLRVDDFNDDGVPDVIALRAKGSSSPRSSIPPTREA